MQNTKIKNNIVIFGASGYLGRHLVKDLLASGNYIVHIFLRVSANIEDDSVWPKSVRIHKGDLKNRKDLIGIINSDSIVVNLAYLWNAGYYENLFVIKNIIQVCKKSQIRKFIQISTAIVVGSPSECWITEDTKCNPSTVYEITKYDIERELLKSKKDFDVVILRPTSVFGIESLPLRKIARDLALGNAFKNYIKSCFLGSRRMNLVPVANVLSAIKFVVDKNNIIDGSIFIVSNDEDKFNNYSDIEKIFLEVFDRETYFIPTIKMPHFILNLFLKFLGKKLEKPCCNFSSKKIRELGFQNVISFREGIYKYAQWYKSTLIKNSD